MSTARDADSSLPDPYRLVSVRAVSAPIGGAGTFWHRYEISQGSNCIVGYRQGAVDTVTRAAETLIAQLNARRGRQRGRVQLALTPAPGTTTSK